MNRTLLLTLSHATVALAAAAAGFAAGIYVLPIWTAAPAPSVAELSAAQAQALFKGRFERNLPGSDALHWGEGEVSVGPGGISLQGRLAPGPDYKLYLSPEFVQTKAEFQAVKARMRRVGDVKSFDGFMVPLPAGVDPAAYTTVVVWCERFEQFISAARYR